MASYTPNLNLIKPADADSYDVANDNGNMDKIDAAYNSLNSKIENITTKGSWTTITVDSNNTYTIPYDGVLYITCGTSDNNDGYLTYNISTWRTIRLNVFGQLSAYQYIPVAQGDVIAFDNKSSNITDILLQYRRM